MGLSPASSAIPSRSTNQAPSEPRLFPARCALSAATTCKSLRECLSHQDARPGIEGFPGLLAHHLRTGPYHSTSYPSFMSRDINVLPFQQARYQSDLRRRRVEFRKRIGATILQKCVLFVAQAGGGFLKIVKRKQGSRDAAKMMQQCSIFAAVKNNKRPGERETLVLNAERLWIERILT